jgi:hypothetical protein
MTSYRYMECLLFSLALALSSVYAQSSTTRQIAASGTASSLNTRTAANGPAPAVATVTAAIAMSNPELTLSFDGVRIDSRLADNGNTFVNEPPDQGLCAGNGFVLESVNSAIRVCDTNGNGLADPHVDAF